MVGKKDKILKSALELFAKNGYNAVPTNKIAKHAGVSEGLIFRHFENKQGLLEAIMDQAFQRASILHAPIISETDPREVLRKSIALPFECSIEEYNFWKLLFKLKWELEISSKEKIQPFVDKLATSFGQLKYQNPEKEAEILNHILENILSGILREGRGTQDHLRDFLLMKYDV